jgi:hypothetical protein
MAAGPYIASARTAQKTTSIACSLVNQGNNVFPSNGCCAVAFLHICYLAVAFSASIVCALNKYATLTTAMYKYLRPGYVEGRKQENVQ